MKRIFGASVLTLGLLSATSALADTRCDVPMAEWKPREALQQKVEAEGWKVSRIKTDDGCYKVYGTNEKGQRYKGKFDPGTLKLLKIEIEYN